MPLSFMFEICNTQDIAVGRARTVEIESPSAHL